MIEHIAYSSCCAISSCWGYDTLKDLKDQKQVHAPNAWLTALFFGVMAKGISDKLEMLEYTPLSTYHYLILMGAGFIAAKNVETQKQIKGLQATATAVSMVTTVAVFALGKTQHRAPIATIVALSAIHRNTDILSKQLVNHYKTYELPLYTVLFGFAYENMLVKCAFVSIAFFMLRYGPLPTSLEKFVESKKDEFYKNWLPTIKFYLHSNSAHFCFGLPDTNAKAMVYQEIAKRLTPYSNHYLGKPHPISKRLTQIATAADIDAIHRIFNQILGAPV